MIRFDASPGRITMTGARLDGAGALVLQATPAAYDNVQSYAKAGGGVVREYRPREEVTSRASLDSWIGAPVVLGHPKMLATKEDVRELAIGRVRSIADGGRGWLEAVLVIDDARALLRIQRGELVELSAGYTVNLESKAGPTYDLIQRDIVVNHLGIAGPGWARAGSGARIDY